MFGLRVIATPGHTMGHISVYDEAASTFISGDALTNVRLAGRIAAAVHRRHGEGG